MNYRIDFGVPLALGEHSAKQVNVRTGKVRDVRRWPSASHKREQEAQQKARAQAAWQAWLNATWTWVLLDPSEASQVVGGSMLELPRPTPYDLGGGLLSLQEPWWPELLRNWPAHGLARSAHPSKDCVCSFAAQRLTAASGCPGAADRDSAAAAASEWGALCALWQQAGIAARAPLVGAYRVQSRGLLHAFAAARLAMLARLAGEGGAEADEAKLKVRLLWHGTRDARTLLDICNDGFDRARAQTCVYGKGCYFASSAAYSDKYACSVSVPGEPRQLRAMLLAAVLVGECVQGSNNMYPPPVKPHSSTGARFENACDSPKSPNIFVTFRDHQAVPVYVAVYAPKS